MILLSCHLHLVFLIALLKAPGWWKGSSIELQQKVLTIQLEALKQLAVLMMIIQRPKSCSHIDCDAGM